MRKLVITDIAKLKIAETFQFIEVKFGKDARVKFVIKIEKTIKIAHNNPEIFPNSEIKQNIKKCVVTKQSTIFYKFDNENVVILSLFDTRQNPKKINKLK